jgi:hypothetical protein
MLAEPDVSTAKTLAKKEASDQCLVSGKSKSLRPPTNL